MSYLTKKKSSFSFTYKEFCELMSNIGEYNQACRQQTNTVTETKMKKLIEKIPDTMLSYYIRYLRKNSTFDWPEINCFYLFPSTSIAKKFSVLAKLFTKKNIGYKWYHVSGLGHRTSGFVRLDLYSIRSRLDGNIFEEKYEKVFIQQINTQTIKSIRYFYAKLEKGKIDMKKYLRIMKAFNDRIEHYSNRSI